MAKKSKKAFGKDMVSKRRDGSREYIYNVKGMRCSSCEVLIENRLLEVEGIESAKVSLAKKRALIEYTGKRPAADELSAIFYEDGFTFSEPKGEGETTREEGEGFKIKGLLASLAIGLFVAIGFIELNRLGLSSLVSVDSNSSLLLFLAFGMMAGLSGCFALVGGIILSMSKQWSDLYSVSDSAWQKFAPHLIFNLGRLISYGLFGTALGALGARLSLSLKFGPLITIIISAVLILFALQMLGLKAFKGFQVTLPKAVTRYVSNESNFKGRYMPLSMGAMTFFLPCGFTITAQGLALISGSALQGGLIMLLFALGTLPMLLGIGLFSLKYHNRPDLSKGFMQAAGVVVLFFALFNINSQMNLLGLSNVKDIAAMLGGSVRVARGSSPIVDGKQVIKMEAFSYEYSPSYFRVRAGIPVRWEITDRGTSGCTNAIISNGLFEGEIPLSPGQVSIKEFTPLKVGRYKFSCWMGMVSGVIDVVDENFSGSLEGVLSEGVEPLPLFGSAQGGGCCPSAGEVSPASPENGEVDSIAPQNP